MNLRERNLNNVKSKWDKLHDIEKTNIADLKNPKIRGLMCRLQGFISGDGSVTNGVYGGVRRYGLRFFPDHKSLIRPYSECLVKVYSKKPRMRDLGGYYELSVYSKVVVEDLCKHGTFGTKNWRITHLVSNRGEVIEWLRAYFDCECYVHDNYLRIQSVNGNGLNQVKGLLKRLGIYSIIYHYNSKNPKHSQVHILSIVRRTDKEKFLRTVGFNHTEKLKKLKSALEYVRPKSRNLVSHKS